MHLRQNSVTTQTHGVRAPGKDRTASPRRASVPVLSDLLERAGLTRPPVALAVGGALLLLYLLSVYADGFEEVFVELDFWTGEVEPIAILTYVLLVHHILNVYGREALQSVRPVVALDDRGFDDLVAHMSAVIVKYQWVPMVAFSGLSVLLLETWNWPFGFLWNGLTSRVISLVEYAFIGSAMYLVVARNLFFTNLFKQPMNIDVFNPAPVRPMGRWGLSVAAAIMGGVTISVLLVGNPQEILSLEHLPMYLVATVVAVLAFFGSMSSTHRVLVRAKERELSAIRGDLSTMYRDLRKRSEVGTLGGMDEMSNTITAYLGYERRIADAQEWPYTANTLRGLFATVLLPIAVTIFQQFISML
jgi:hypothetical protein